MGDLNPKMCFVLLSVDAAWNKVELQYAEEQRLGGMLRGLRPRQQAPTLAVVSVNT